MQMLHVKVLENLGYNKEARIVAKQYHDRISKNKNLESNYRLSQTVGDLARFYVSGKWPERAQSDFVN